MAEPLGLGDLGAVELQRTISDLRPEAPQAVALPVDPREHLAEERPVVDVDAELLADLAPCGLAWLLPALDPAARQLPSSPPASVRMPDEEDLTVAGEA